MITIQEVLEKHKIVRYKDVFRKVMTDYAAAIIEECAEQATTETLSDYDRGGELYDYETVDKNSILKLLKEIK